MAKKILIIDDDRGLQIVLGLALKDAGYEVISAANGQEAIDLLPEAQPDLVLSDVMMPYVDGVQLFDALKEQLRDAGIPIVIMTALNRKAWFADLEAEGAVIIHKPFEIDYLIAVVGMLLDK
jgi:CheY-like chemotaxis protein